MFQRFTDRARTAVVVAREEAVTASSPTIGAHHLLLGVIADADGLAARVLASSGVSAADVRAAVAAHAAGTADAASGRPSPDVLDDEDVAALRTIGIDAEEVLRRVATDLGGLPAPTTPGRGRVPLDADAKKALELALREAVALKHRWIGTEHLLLGLLRGGSPVVSAAARDLAVGHAPVRDLVQQMLRRSG